MSGRDDVSNEYLLHSLAQGEVSPEVAAATSLTVEVRQLRAERTTPAPVGAAMALDLDAVEAEFLRQCGGCDAGLMVGCTCSQRDFRPTMLALVAEVRRLTRLGQCDLDLLMRAEAA